MNMNIMLSDKNDNLFIISDFVDFKSREAAKKKKNKSTFYHKIKVQIDEINLRMIDYLLIHSSTEKSVVTIMNMELNKFSWQSVKMKNLETKSRLEISTMTAYRNISSNRFMLMNNQYKSTKSNLVMDGVKHDDGTSDQTILWNGLVLWANNVLIQDVIRY